MLIYLAGPLDGVDFDEAREWYEEAASFAPEGAVLYCPGRAFLLQGDDPASMDHANRSVIGMATDVVVAKLDGPGKALGTCREIEFARLRDRPVIVVSDSLQDSLMSWDLKVVGTLEEAFDLVCEMMEIARGR